jgi:uncharacterized membrane protein YbhN (UPF0104 family)
MRQYFSLLLKLSVSVGIVALVVSRVDLTAMGQTVQSLGFGSVVIALGVAFLQTVLCVHRWIWIQAVLSRAFGFWRGLQVMYAALCLGQCLPSFVGGDAYRMYWLYRQGHPVAQAVRGVVLDRVSAFLALVFMLAAGVPWILVRFHDAAALTTMWTVLFCGLGGTVVLFSGDVLPPGWRRWRALAELATLSTTAREVLLTTRTGLWVTGVSVLVHTSSAVVMFLFARDMGLPLRFLDCLVLMPLIMLISALPISIAGWGVREGVMVAGLSVLGVRAEQALVLSLLLGFVALFNGLFGAFPLAFGRVRLAAVRRSPVLAEQAGAAP